MLRFITKIFGTKNDREIKRMNKVVAKINQLEPEFEALSDADLKAKTGEFKEKIKEGATLDQMLPEAFAAVREAGKRAMGMRHFDVQLVGGMALHDGKIAEMRTGEGKTLVATLPAYLNALGGDPVHLVTVNEYLAQRDANWMRPLYEALGLTVGFVVPGQDPQEKYDAYRCDITYGTNNEYGFDYLRDNMAQRSEDRYQRGLGFAIVDEVDSILIDEARTPLIISGAASDSSHLYQTINSMIPKLDEQVEAQEGHYVIDEKMRSADLTEQGHELVEKMLIEQGLLGESDSLYQATNLNLLHHVHVALKAHVLFTNNVEYIVQDNEVVLIDENTGRTMPGRRLSEGLHQAIEAKEGVAIQSESQTMASTTFQNYFRLYDKLSGMTGTADTEAYEMHQIYGLDVLVVPTNKPSQREDANDLIYLSKEEKYDAIIAEIKECQAKGAPVLVGTATIESSEIVSGALKKAKIEHSVLNAKFHEKEAEIIAQAGRPGAVTIATNMAGRGTDIVLGGNLEVELDELGDDTPESKKEKVKQAWQKRHEQVLEAGGLHIIGTERHESRRIDNQLRGRSGRQGDPGYSRFFLSLEDDLMRIFASDRMKAFMQRMGLEKGEAIEHRMVNNAIEKAQRRVEGRNFDIRKQLLEFDDVANDQRQVVYSQRNDLLDMEEISDVVEAIREDVVADMVAGHIPPMSIPEQWDVDGLEQVIKNELGVDVPVKDWMAADKQLDDQQITKRINDVCTEVYNAKCAQVGEQMQMIERQIMLQVLDNLWKEHLAQMDALRQGVGLRGYAQKNPKQEYKRESFELFQQLLENMKHETIRFLMRVQIRSDEEIRQLEEQQRRLEAQAKAAMEFQHADASGVDGEQEQGAPKPAQRGPKVGRNEPCPCGSGKKYKACCGKLNA